MNDSQRHTSSGSAAISCYIRAVMQQRSQSAALVGGEHRYSRTSSASHMPSWPHLTAAVLPPLSSSSSSSPPTSPFHPRPSPSICSQLPDETGLMEAAAGQLLRLREISPRGQNVLFLILCCRLCCIDLCPPSFSSSADYVSLYIHFYFPKGHYGLQYTTFGWFHYDCQFTSYVHPIIYHAQSFAASNNGKVGQSNQVSVKLIARHE